MKPRQYQINAEECVFEAWKEHRATLVVMPTGTGKTILFASIIKKRKRTMVIAHRQELIWQARDKIQKVTGLTVDVEMGEYKSKNDADLFRPTAQVIVATIQTLTAGGDGAGRMGKFSPDDFDTLIIDEAHHATSASYRRVIEFFLQNKNLKVLGVTATPDRSDEEALGQIFESVAFDYEILDAIKDGWLVPIEQQMVSIESLDFSQVRTTAGDLNGADLEAVMKSEKNLHGMASATIDIIGNRRGIGFAASVSHAKILSEIFNRHKTGMSNMVCAGTEKEERKKIISDFARGKIQWLWNCGVFTEGFDDSGIEVISMARPTKSRALYAQMAGRATRPHETIAHSLNNALNNPLRRGMIARSVKSSCLIIDFVGNSGRHKLMTTADILSGNVSDDVVEASINLARKSGKPMRMDKTMQEEEERQAEIKAKKLADEARHIKLIGKASYKIKGINPFDILQIKPIASRGWDKNKSFSEGQRGFLKSAGFDPDQLEYAQGRQIMDALGKRREKNLCTLKQAGLLKKHGCDVNVTFDQAKSMIDQIAQNGWRKPANFTVPEVATKQVAEAGELDPDDVPY